MARILLVDGDRRYRSTCSEDLERQGHEVLTASNGFDALRLVAEHAPEVIVTEVRLPGSDGIDLIYRLLMQTPRPIVILNSESSYHRDGFLSWAADADLRKSRDTSELQAKVRALLKSRWSEPREFVTSEELEACPR